MRTGVLVDFGGYEWRVLDMRDGAALLITEKVIERRVYHGTGCDITWADCDLRAYLNGDFLDRFSMEDRQRILRVKNVNPDNSWYGAKGGEDTWDSVFLLSIEEAACRYFGDSSHILLNPGNQKYKYWFNRKDENNIKRLTNSSWWLRSPGRINRAAAYIHGLASNQRDSSGGCVGVNGNGVNAVGGVRPAVWVE